jgi:hypothetical protein
MMIDLLRHAVEAIVSFGSQKGPNREFEQYYSELVSHDGVVAPHADEALYDFEVMLQSHLAG